MKLLDEGQDPNGIHGHTKGITLGCPFGGRYFTMTSDEEPYWSIVGVLQNH